MVAGRYTRHRRTLFLLEQPSSRDRARIVLPLPCQGSSEHEFTRKIKAKKPVEMQTEKEQDRNETQFAVDVLLTGCGWSDWESALVNRVGLTPRPLLPACPQSTDIPRPDRLVRFVGAEAHVRRLTCVGVFLLSITRPEIPTALACQQIARPSRTVIHLRSS
jgi:hypothetical protein